MNMNKTQAQTGAASLLGVLAGFLAGSGYFGFSVADWTTILGGLASIGAVIWPFIATRAQALKDTTATLPNTTVVTDKASAEALPNNKDVVAVTPDIVSAIKKAS